MIVSQAQLINNDSIEPKLKDVYKSHTDSLYQVFYVDDQIVLLRDEQTSDTGQHYHRMEKRSDFEMMVDAGQLVLQPDSELDLSGESKTDWSQVDLIGAKTSSNLHDAGYTIPFEVQMANDSELLAIGGLGQKGLENLREFTQ